MGNLIFVVGGSGTGKSFSLRNFKADELGVINVQGKPLPFKGTASWDIVNTDDSIEIIKEIERMGKKYKTIVVDDYQYVMANEFMRRATERGYDKFTDIARHAWDIANAAKALPQNVNIYIFSHTDRDPDGFEKLKTIGRLLDEKIVLEGMSTIVLKTAVSDGQYMFLTQNNGKDTVKSPAGMFPSYAIDNDLKYVDEKIRNYYEIGDFLTDEEILKADETAKKEGIDITEERESKRRGRKKKTEGITEALAEEKEKGTEVEGTETTKDEPPKRNRRRRSLKEEYVDEIVNLNTDPTGETEELPFDDIIPPPTRKRRARKPE